MIIFKLEMLMIERELKMRKAVYDNGKTPIIVCHIASGKRYQILHLRILTSFAWELRYIKLYLYLKRSLKCDMTAKNVHYLMYLFT